MADEWSKGIDWFQYMTTKSEKNFFFTKSSYDQYSVNSNKTFGEILEAKLAEVESDAKLKLQGPPQANIETEAEPGNEKWKAGASVRQDAPNAAGARVQEQGSMVDGRVLSHEDHLASNRSIAGPGTGGRERIPIKEIPNRFSFLAPLKNPRIPYPRESSLTHEEHKKYLELYTRFNAYVPTNPTQADIQEIMKFKELQLKVGPEQEEFMKYLEQSANKCINDYIGLHREARRFAEELLNTRMQRSDHYPRYYTNLDTVPLELLKPFDAKTAPVLSCQRQLLDLGPTPKVVLPTITYQTIQARPKAFVDYEKLTKRYSPTAKSTLKSQSWTKLDCSTDVNAEKLAIQYGADVVLAGGVVTCIMDNNEPAYEREWEIPIVVKQYMVDENGQKVPRKVVFIDKPFPSKTVCPRYLNHLYHKYTLKTLLVHQQKATTKFRSKAKEAEKPEESIEEPESEEDLLYSLDDLETFGTDRVSFDVKKKAGKETKKDKDLTSLQTQTSGREGEVPDGGSRDGDKCSGQTTEGAVEVAQHGHGGVAGKTGNETLDDMESPQSPGFQSPQSPDADDLESPGSPVSQQIESPMSPGAGEQTTGRTGTSADKGSPLSPSFDEPASPVAQPRERPLLSGPKIIPMERIDDDEHSRGTEGTCEAQDGGTSSAIGGLEEQGEEPIKRSLRGRNVEYDLGVTGTEGCGEEEVGWPRRGRPRRNTRNAKASEKGETKSSKVVPANDTDSDDDAALVIDIGPKDDMSPPRRKTRQSEQLVSTSKTEPEVEGHIESSDAISDPSTTPRITRSGSHLDANLPEPSSRSLRSRKQSGSDSIDDKAAGTSPIGRVTRSRQSVSPMAMSDMDTSLPLHGRKRHSDTDDGADNAKKRSTRSSDQGIPAPTELPAPRKRGRPKKVPATQESHPKSSEGPGEEKIELQTEPKNTATESEATDTGAEVVKEQTVEKTDSVKTELMPVAMETDAVPVESEMIAKAPAVHEHMNESQSKADVAESSDVTPKPQGATKAKRAVKSEKSSAMTLDAILNLQQQMLRPGEKMKEEQSQPAANTRPPKTDQVRPCSLDNNAVYGLWSLADLNLIIRTSNHGVLTDANTLKTKPVYLFPKLEYQPMFGVEQVTVSEQVKMWTSAFLRLNCNVIRARICAFTSEIIMLEDLEPSKILPPRGMFDPGVGMQKLHTILDKVVSLPPGAHILRHTPGEKHCQILQNVPQKKSGLYDLHQSYILPDLRHDDDPIRWVPIDPNVIMPFHRWLYRIPATFRPKGGLVNFSVKKPDAPFPRGNPKKKKKSKSKKRQTATEPELKEEWGT